MQPPTKLLTTRPSRQPTCLSLQLRHHLCTLCQSRQKSLTLQPTQDQSQTRLAAQQSRVRPAAPQNPPARQIRPQQVSSRPASRRRLQEQHWRQQLGRQLRPASRKLHKYPQPALQAYSCPRPSLQLAMAHSRQLACSLILQGVDSPKSGLDTNRKLPAHRRKLPWTCCLTGCQLSSPRRWSGWRLQKVSHLCLAVSPAVLCRSLSLGSICAWLVGSQDRAGSLQSFAVWQTTRQIAILHAVVFTAV